MKHFVSVLVALNMVLAAVCYATTSHAETCADSRTVCVSENR